MGDGEQPQQSVRAQRRARREREESGDARARAIGRRAPASLSLPLLLPEAMAMATCRFSAHLPGFTLAPPPKRVIDAKASARLHEAPPWPPHQSFATLEDAQLACLSHSMCGGILEPDDGSGLALSSGTVPTPSATGGAASVKLCDSARCELEQGTWYWGEHLRTVHKLQSVEGCCDACIATAGCVSFNLMARASARCTHPGVSATLTRASRLAWSFAIQVHHRPARRTRRTRRTRRCRLRRLPRHCRHRRCHHRRLHPRNHLCRRRPHPRRRRPLRRRRPPSACAPASHCCCARAARRWSSNGPRPRSRRSSSTTAPSTRLSSMRRSRVTAGAAKEPATRAPATLSACASPLPPPVG